MSCKNIDFHMLITFIWNNVILYNNQSGMIAGTSRISKNIMFILLSLRSPILKLKTDFSVFPLPDLLSVPPSLFFDHNFWNTCRRRMFLWIMRTILKIKQRCYNVRRYKLWFCEKSMFEIISKMNSFGGVEFSATNHNFRITCCQNNDFVE